MEKILKPYTIVPENLYIQRDADKQVKNIISDMGRPGYVLVSRQMGKTNLLINAKNKLETPNDAFVYIDLSNTFPTAKGCFENIIDNAIEAYPEKFEDVSKVIFERRTELKDTPPHKQHTNELRFLLQSLKGGKLVIILDEIDALTKTDYSDQIFSQIRSTYFGSRVNYKEFYNLTYLLSGVVEPTEIIKDPKVSPFNIGQKIYLNDFSRTEFDQFIRIANLNINPESVDRIFYWTNGNPRISWDVCSEVENKSKNRECNSQLIDKIVQDLYLTSFDKAPIDNIREIVSNDREVRNSIIEIEYKKGKLISDKIKSKLYLAGIINYDEDDVHIKNEIIRKSLNYEWIRSLEEAEKGLLGLAFESYENGKYSEALLLFESFLEQNEFPEENRDICFYYMGYSIYLEGKYAKAIEYFNKAIFDVEESQKLHFGNENLKGLAYKGNKEYDKSRERYEYVIRNSIVDDNYLRASLNLGHLFMNNFFGDKTEDAIHLFENIIENKLKISKRVKEKSLNYFKCVATYNLADIYKSKNEYEKAEKTIRNILPIITDETKSSLMLQLSQVIENQEEKVKILLELIDYVSENDIELPNTSAEKPLDLDIVQVLDILLSLYETNKTIFKDVVDKKSNLFINKTKGELLYEIAIHSINQNKLNLGIQLLNDIYSDDKKLLLSLEPSIKYNTLKLLAYFANTKDSTDNHVEYIDLFINKRLDEIDYLDMEIFANLIYTLIEKKDYSIALRYIDIINSLKETVTDNLLINYVVIYHLELNIYVYLNSISKAFDKAEQILNISNDEKIKKHNSNLLGEAGLDVIKNYAESVLRSKNKTSSPVKTLKKYGRNQLLKVRYKDGTILETKFKKIETDILSGECIVLE